MATSLPQALYTAEQVRKLDAAAIHDFGIPGFELMKRAGQSAFDQAMQHWPELARGAKLQIFCGAGNNAGDGYVMAALARQRYMPVRVIALRDPAGLTGDAARAWEWFQGLGGIVEPWSDQTAISGDVVVDALLGTGLSGDVRCEYRDAIDLINGASRPVLAIDVPSGLSADTGSVRGRVVNADLTVTFIGMKQGLLTGEGPQYCGEITFARLSVPDGVYDIFPAASQRLNRKNLSKHISPRRRNAHKGSHGHLLLIGGDYGMAGALIMAAEAALKSGAGMVSVVTRAEHVSAFNSRCPVVMAKSATTPKALKALLPGKTAIVIGPGLGQSPWGRSMLATALKSGLPLILDADALNLMAAETGKRLAWPASGTIITPHPGEAARLLDSDTASVQYDRFASLSALQQLTGGVVLLKGAGTVISNDDETWLCSSGNPGMGVAGMGDVLSGIIGAMVVQGHDLITAAQLGVWLHAQAGDECARQGGEIGLVATDLPPVVRTLLNSLVVSG